MGDGVTFVPFLMSKDVASNLFFLLLDEVDIREHTLVLEALCELG